MAGVRPDRLRPVTPLTARDRALLAQLAEHEPLGTSELRLLFFTGERTCRQRLAQPERLDVTDEGFAEVSNRFLLRLAFTKRWNVGDTSCKATLLFVGNDFILSENASPARTEGSPITVPDH